MGALKALWFVIYSFMLMCVYVFRQSARVMLVEHHQRTV